jgi:hypothetical protein
MAQTQEHEVLSSNPNAAKKKKDGTEVWTQEFVLARQVLYHLDPFPRLDFSISK